MSTATAPEPSAPGPSTPAMPAPRGERRTFAFAALAFVLGAGVAAFLGRARAAEPAPAVPPVTVDPQGVTLATNAPQWQYVQVAVAEQKPALAPVPAPGRVTLDEKRTASVGTPLAGRVASVLARTGDRVRKGERLFSVRSGAFTELERDRRAAEEQLAVRQRIRDRVKELVRLQATPEKELLSAEADVAEAELALNTAASKKESLGVVPEGDSLFWVTAPRDGTVVEMAVFEGQEVTPDREAPLVRISDLSEVLVLADVQETDAADLAVGAQVRIRGRGAEGDGVSGTIERISEVVDPARHSVEARIRVLNATRALRPNGFVEASLPAAAGERVRVPSEAVVTDGARSVVFVDRGGGRLDRVGVVTGRQGADEVEVVQGLSAGQRYVAHGALLLQNQIDLAE